MPPTRDQQVAAVKAEGYRSRAGLGGHMPRRHYLFPGLALAAIGAEAHAYLAEPARFTRSWVYRPGERVLPFQCTE